MWWSAELCRRLRVEGINSRGIWEEEAPQECGTGSWMLYGLVQTQRGLWQPLVSLRAWGQNHRETSLEGPMRPKRTVSGPLRDFITLLLTILASAAGWRASAPPIWSDLQAHRKL